VEWLSDKQQTVTAYTQKYARTTFAAAIL